MVGPMGHDPHANDVQLVIDNELRLLDPHMRRSADEAEKLLHPEFFEFGASGRRWDRLETVAALRVEDLPGEMDRAVVSDIDAARLADDVVLITYVTQQAGRCARRASVWRRTAMGWCIYFHQATPVPVP